MPAYYPPDLGYQRLAIRCVVPAVRALAAGQRDVEKLLAAAFSPLVHIVLDGCLDTGAPAVLGLLHRAIEPPAPESVTRFVAPPVALHLLACPPLNRPVVAFDLRPGGCSEFAAYHYAAPCAVLCDASGRISCFYQEVLPLVIAVLRGWGVTILVIPPAASSSTQAEVHWTTLIHTGEPR